MKTQRFLIVLSCLMLVISAACFAWYFSVPTAPPVTAPSASTSRIPTAPTTEPTVPTTVPTVLPTEPTEPPTEPTEPPTEPTEPPTEPTEPPTEPTEPPTEPTEPPIDIEISANQAFVYDVSAEDFLFIHGALEQAVEPASITKLFTAYVGLQYLPEDMLLTAGEEVNWIASGSSRAYIYKGHQLTVKMCIQGMIIPSGNDAAYVLAVNAGRAISGDPDINTKDAYDVFVAEMNRQAQQLGMINTHFVNPDGMSAEGHYTCMQDLLTIAKLALNTPLILEAAQTQRMRAIFPSGHYAEWTNSNLLLDQKSSYYCADAFGLKTGSTSTAGKCLLSAFLREDRLFIVCVMGCPTNASRYSDTLTLYEAFQ